MRHCDVSCASGSLPCPNSQTVSSGQKGSACRIFRGQKCSGRVYKLYPKRGVRKSQGDGKDSRFVAEKSNFMIRQSDGCAKIHNQVMRNFMPVFVRSSKRKLHPWLHSHRCFIKPVLRGKQISIVSRSLISAHLVSKRLLKRRGYIYPAEPGLDVSSGWILK